MKAFSRLLKAKQEEAESEEKYLGFVLNLLKGSRVLVTVI